MAEETKDPKAAPAPSSGGGGKSALLGLVLPAVLAGAAAFGGAKVAAAGHSTAKHEEAPATPPGPTMTLEPFILSIPDATGKMHAMKVSIALEFTAHEKEETIKALTPRVRDASLSFLRTLTYEMASNREETDKGREELLEKYKKVGATTAEKVLITELILQ